MKSVVLSPFGAARTATIQHDSLSCCLECVEILNEVSTSLGLQPTCAAWVLELTRLAAGTAAPTAPIFFLLLALHISNSTGNTAFPLTNIAEILSPVPNSAFTVWNNASREEVISQVLLMAETKTFPSHFFGYTLLENKPFLVLNEHVCTQRMVLAESSVVQCLHEKMKTPSSAQLTVQAQLSPNFTLNPNQVIAVQKSLTHAVSFITGGPGTGKTSVVTAIVRTYIEGGGDPTLIALAAPTGKAAKRLDETIRSNFARMDMQNISEKLQPATTLHRLVGISENRTKPRHHAAFPINPLLVVVDEASMIDVILFKQLLDALKKSASIIFLGDANQLPSVNAGALFRAITTNPAFEHVTHKLETSYRMNPQSKGAGRNILMVANGVNCGKVVFAEDCGKQNKNTESMDSDELIKTPESPTQLSNSGVDFLSAQSNHLHFMDLLKHFVPVPTNAVLNGFARHESMLQAINEMCASLEKEKILCVTNSGRYGSDSINRMMHNIYSANFRQGQHSESFLPGEPVIVVENDYSRNIFNGDIGIVVKIHENDGVSPHVAFRRAGENPTLIPLEAVAQNIKLAFAITVHKSQGSEYERTLLCLPEKDGALCSREIVYTALTRASKHVIIWGTQTVLQNAVERRMIRTSFLDT